MALTKQEKNDIVVEVSELLTSSKLTVVAKYQGTPVKAMQTLRKQAKEGNTVVKVVKNRLVIKAIQQNEQLKTVYVTDLNG